MATVGPQFFPPLGPVTTQGAFEPKGWDRCVLAGKVIPGQCRIPRAHRKLKKDPKKKNGADGSNPTYRGLDPQPLELEITTFTDPDREELASIISPFVPQPGQKPATVSIDHPSLRILRISAVQIVGAGALIPEQGSTKARMILELEDAIPAKNSNATTTPKSAPKRKISNIRAKQNPLPTEQAGFSAPPESLQSGG